MEKLISKKKKNLIRTDAIWTQSCCSSCLATKIKTRISCYLCTTAVWRAILPGSFHRSFLPFKGALIHSLLRSPFGETVNTWEKVFKSAEGVATVPKHYQAIQVWISNRRCSKGQSNKQRLMSHVRSSNFITCKLIINFQIHSKFP